MSTAYPQTKTTMPALKEALWPLSAPGIFTTPRALILYWLIWAITTSRQTELPRTYDQRIDRALSMSSIKALYLTICLVGNTIFCFMVLNLTYLFFLLGLSWCTWVFIRGYLNVVKPYHGGGRHLADAPVFSWTVPLRQWALRQLESGYPAIDDVIADFWKFLSLKVKPKAGREGGRPGVMGSNEIVALQCR